MAIFNRRIFGSIFNRIREAVGVTVPPAFEVEGRYRARQVAGTYAARTATGTYRLRSITGRWRALE